MSYVDLVLQFFFEIAYDQKVIILFTNLAWISKRVLGTL